MHVLKQEEKDRIDRGPFAWELIPFEAIWAGEG